MTGPSVRSDLAVEAHEFLVGGRKKKQVPGVHVSQERHAGISITRVEISDEEAENLMQKPQGRYITLEVPNLRQRDPGELRRATRYLMAELRRLLTLPKDASILVVGLGNWKATPDALGPRVVEKTLITRHLYGLVPEDLRGKLTSVAAIAPGVLGLTGIETGEIIRAVVERIKPDVVVAVDALAAREVSRLITTLQLADTGIHPGSGVGNHRSGLTKESLGVPVIALGVPTVVQAMTIAEEAFSRIADSLRGEAHFYEILREIDAEEKKGLLREVLASNVGELMVTPKEIDLLMEDLATLISGALNAAFHPGVDAAMVRELLH